MSIILQDSLPTQDDVKDEVPYSKLMRDLCRGQHCKQGQHFFPSAPRLVMQHQGTLHACCPSSHLGFARGTLQLLKVIPSCSFHVSYPLRLHFLTYFKLLQAQMRSAIIFSLTVYIHKTSHLSIPN